MRSDIKIVQQVRADEVADLQVAYQDMGVSAEISPFFDDMPKLWRDAHLVLCRAGGSTIAEASATGRPAIFIPLPSAVDDHQTANAKAVVDNGGGWLMPQNDLDAKTLGDKITSLLTQPDQLLAAAKAAREIAQPNAANKIADALIDIATKQKRNAT